MSKLRIQKSKKYQASVIMFVVLAVITGVYISVLMLVDMDSKTKLTYEHSYSAEDIELLSIIPKDEPDKANNNSYSRIVINADNIKEDKLYVIYETSEEFWTDDSGRIGCQYDICIYNNAKYKVSNWTLVLTVSDESKIDSFWNGEYSIEKNKVTVTPVEYNSYINSKASIPIGCIMYTNGEIGIEGYKIVATEVREFQNTDGYTYAIIIACVLLICVLICFIMLMHLKRTNDIAKENAEIINESLYTFANIIDAKDTYTRGHSIRVALYSKEIARRMKKSADEQERIYRIALLHDIGKVGVTDDILKKAGRLNDNEIEIIKKHAEIGGHILEKFGSIDGLADGAGYHHERIDGKGYPEGLKDKEIPEVARIICIADSYDAMSSSRCYRKGLGEEYIVSELKACAGSQFDAEIVPFMLEMIAEGFAPIKDNGDEPKKRREKSHKKTV